MKEMGSISTIRCVIAMQVRMGKDMKMVLFVIILLTWKALLGGY